MPSNLNFMKKNLIFFVSWALFLETSLELNFHPITLVYDQLDANSATITSGNRSLANSVSHGGSATDALDITFRVKTLLKIHVLML